MIAVLTLQIAKGGSQKELPSQLQTMGNFEQMYNYACYLIEQEKFEEALQLLDKAIGLEFAQPFMLMIYYV